jgi:hypothetical protein
MEQPADQGAVIPQFTVPVASRKKKGSALSVLTVAVVLLALLVIYYVWRQRRYAKPRCSDYSGGPAAVCAQAAKACGTNSGCLNAVAHCMPIVNAALKPHPAGKGGAESGIINRLETAELRACTQAIARVDPRYAAHLLAGAGAPCMPAEYASRLGDEATYNVMLDVARAAEPLLPWSVRVAREMPACSAPVTPPYAPVTPPYAPVTPPYAPLSPVLAPLSPILAPVLAPLLPPYAPVTPPYAPVTPPYAPVTPAKH